MDYPDSPDLYQGKFTDGDPVAGIPASVASAEHMNAIYDELATLIAAGGIAPDAVDLAQVAKSVGNQLRSKRLFDVSGTANAIVLTTPAGRQPVTALSDYDEFSFIVSATNTGVMTIAVDGLDPVPISGVTDATQIIETALLTVRYIDNAFVVASQINPKTGNPVSEIGLLKWQPTDAMSVGMMIYDGGELSRATHPILLAKAMKTGLMDQSTKDADLETYGGFWGDGDGATTFTCPIFSDFISATGSDRELGSFEYDTFQGFDPVGAAAFGRDRGWAGGVQYYNGGGGFIGSNVAWDATGADPDSKSSGRGYIVSDGVNGTPRISDRTKPRNIALHAVFLV